MNYYHRVISHPFVVDNKLEQYLSEIYFDNDLLAGLSEVLRLNCMRLSWVFERDFDVSDASYEKIVTACALSYQLKTIYEDCDVSISVAVEDLERVCNQIDQLVKSDPYITECDWPDIGYLQENSENEVVVLRKYVRLDLWIDQVL